MVSQSKFGPFAVCVLCWRCSYVVRPFVPHALHYRIDVDALGLQPPAWLCCLPAHLFCFVGSVTSSLCSKKLATSQCPKSWERLSSWGYVHMNAYCQSCPRSSHHSSATVVLLHDYCTPTRLRGGRLPVAVDSACMNWCVHGCWITSTADAYRTPANFVYRATACRGSESFHCNCNCFNHFT